MRKIVVLVAGVALAGTVSASWYWPFGSDDAEAEPPRVSELMEPATKLIDDAADLASDGKTGESVEKYRAALAELDRIEMENPDRAASPEFATLRNKRAYVSAAIDSLLLSQVRENAKVVAVSDTTELEKKLAAEKAKKSGGGKASRPAAEPQPPAAPEAPAAEKPRTSVAAKPRTPREAAMQAIASGDEARAEALIDGFLKEKPNSALALNLRATLRARQGRMKEAEAALDQAIMSNPRNYFAYYNMARLMLQLNVDDKSVARRYYETGRAVGGPADESLEAALK